jgi:hypothetical protein
VRAVVYILAAVFCYFYAGYLEKPLAEITVKYGSRELSRLGEMDAIMIQVAMIYGVKLMSVATLLIILFH